MPQAWSNKEERQYEHIKESSKRRGKSTKLAKEIAARTVNKQRRKKGKTRNKTSQGTGNPNVPLEQRTRQELYNLATKLSVSGRSQMNKHDLAEAVRKVQ